ncbi:hypothetical protein [uncultured Muribaculum sp.]|uniref:hypothetical protein n=1 Tax=uncultured Muribaculum sp. TaxID=1918613 RepID=UPI0025B79BBE|nr:hypothetical protein [uncultured Muribaculum sp.]
MLITSASPWSRKTSHTTPLHAQAAPAVLCFAAVSSTAKSTTHSSKGFDDEDAEFNRREADELCEILNS